MAKALASFVSVSVAVADVPDYDQLWASFKNEYGRNYVDAEEVGRFEIFKSKVAEVFEVNAMNLPYKLAINKFSDVSDEEMRTKYMGKKTLGQLFGDVPLLGEHAVPVGQKLVDSLDWEQKGAVTPVKNQGSCGSCWSFGSTGSMEGHWFVSSGKLVSLSEQQLMDCDKSDSGCGGGLESSAITYASGAGMCSEASYPYQGRAGSCQISSCDMAIPSGAILGYKRVGSTVSALMSAVQLGPVNIGVGADGSGFQSYSSGVLTNCPSRSDDHAVLLVGYGTDGGEDYWRIKNSWGSSWGERGYIRATRQGDPCGMLDDTGYPQISGAPTPSPTPSPSPTPTPTPGCVDVDSASDCSYWMEQGYCSSSSQYYDYMRSNCCHTCGFGEVQV